jgi:putative hydrolase of the HAD superfamily
MIRGIIFDFDDTLGNREDYAYKLYTEIISKYCTNELLRESIVQHCMIWDQNGNESKKYVQDMLRSVYTINLNVNLDTYWDDHLWEHTTLFKDAKETLMALKSRGYSLAIITNGKREGQMRKLEISGISRLVDVIVISEDCGYEKPDPQIFQNAADKLHLACNECIYIGDTFAKDIRGSLEAGMEAIWFWPHGYRACNYPVTRISDLSELLKMFEGKRG